MVSYQPQNVQFAQIAQVSDMTSTGIFVMGSGMHLEPSTLTDKNLPGGAYITDLNYRPILAFDHNGQIRYLDTNVIWSVSSV